MSSNVDERTGRELYGPPFAAAVDAGVGSVMCSFQRINNTFSCASPTGLTSWLKGDLGFGGFVVSDWGAVHGSAPFALGGLDQEQEWVLRSCLEGGAAAVEVQLPAAAAAGVGAVIDRKRGESRESYPLFHFFPMNGVLSQPVPQSQSSPPFPDVPLFHSLLLV